MERYDLRLGDSRDVLRDIAENSVDSVVCDPPYALDSIVKRFGKPNAAPAKPGTDGAFARASAGFMGQTWDTGETAFNPEFWAEVYRVLKPGAFLLAFSGSRTYHRLACAIEDAGFEIRDMVEWIYGSGMAKSHDAGDGRGTAVKPAHEPICMARKPLIGTVAENIAAYGTGALNIDVCRIGGRFPANLIHDGSPEVMALFPSDAGGAAPVRGTEPSSPTNGIYGQVARTPSTFYDDDGSAARFFYCAKASKADREEGCKNLPDAVLARSNLAQTKEDRGEVVAEEAGGFNAARKRKNNHPTVKPTDLMRYLCRLVTPAGGLILDPFMGSGSTGKAAMMEGYNFLGIERDDKYFAIADARLAHAATKGYQEPLI